MRSIRDMRLYQDIRGFEFSRLIWAIGYCTAIWMFNFSVFSGMFGLALFSIPIGVLTSVIVANRADRKVFDNEIKLLMRPVADPRK